MTQYTTAAACCTKVFSDYLIQCPESITIYTLNLAPATDYLVMITSPIFGSITVTATTDASGYLVIETDALPPGFMVQYTGGFSIRVYADGDEVAACEPIQLLIARKYEEVQVDLLPGSAVKDKIGCPLPLVSEGE